MGTWERHFLIFSTLTGEKKSMLKPKGNSYEDESKRFIPMKHFQNICIIVSLNLEQKVPFRLEKLK